MQSPPGLNVVKQILPVRLPCASVEACVAGTIVFRSVGIADVTEIPDQQRRGALHQIRRLGRCNRRQIFARNRPRLATEPGIWLAGLRMNALNNNLLTGT